MHENRTSKNEDGNPESRMDLWQSVLANAPAHVEHLITHGEVYVDERNDLGETALHLACRHGLDDVATLLLAYGADVALQDWESGWTALHRSVYHAHLSTSLLLLRHAHQTRGRQFMKTLLYDTKDFGHQTAMALVSSYDQKPRNNDSFDDDDLEEKPVKNDEVTPVHDQDNDDEKGPTPDVWGEQLPSRSSAPPRGGTVYTFGKVDFQLGYHLPHVNVQSSPRLVELPITSAIVQISASKFHTVALNDRGQIYVWGFGKGGRLGTGTEFDHVEPTRLTSLDEIPMARVAAGENHTLALSRSGQVFSWGSNSFGQLGHSVKTSNPESRFLPKRVDVFKGMFMTDISASGVHSGAICGDDGGVYTWGSNRRGQLGRKDGFGIDQPNPTPKRVYRLMPGHALSVIYEPHDALRAVQIAMSDVHTCVILRCSKNGQSQGQVWQFGYGSNVPTRILFKEKRRTTSQLLMNDAWVPRWRLRSDDIVAVACAPNHSIVLSACGSVYTWGHNGDALSHQKTDFIPPGTPQRVLLDKYGPIVNICASQDHCAVVTAAGDLVSWGCGPQGVLGHGPGNSWQPSPKQVHGAKKVVAVAAGHQHTVVLVAPRLPRQADEFKDGKRSPPTLRHLLETKIAQFLDLSNVATVWKYANAYSQLALEQYCVDYMRLNWDALLEMGSKDRLDALFDLMLPAMPKAVRRGEFTAPVVDDKPSKSKAASERKPSGRKPSIALDDKATESPKPSSASAVAPPVPEPVVPALSLAAPVTPSPELKPQAVPAMARRVKGAKFVPVDAFFSAGKDEPKSSPVPLAVEPRSFLSPWNAATPSAAPPPSSSTTAVPRVVAAVPAKSPTLAPAVFPSLGDSLLRPARKESVNHAAPSSSSGGLPRKSPPLGASASPKMSLAPSPVLEPRKQVLCYDGSERPQVSAFSLDAFIKKGNRKKSRSDSVDQSKAAPIWGAVPAVGKAEAAPSSAAAAMPLTSLKEIQEEEQARARAEAAAKAKHGGFVRKMTSVNSWGLVPQQSHISFEELQRREEEERFLEEQRQILAQIERENRQREADEKRRLAKQQQAARQRQPQPHNAPQKKGDRKKDAMQPRDAPPQAKASKLKKKKTTAETTAASDASVATVDEASARRDKPKRDRVPDGKPAAEAGTAAAAAAANNDDVAKPKPKPKKKTAKPRPPQLLGNGGAPVAPTPAA